MKATMAWRCRTYDDLVKDYLCVPLTPIVISAAQSKNKGVTEWYQEPKIIMANVIPPDHVDDLPVVEPNQPDDVPVIPEPVLVDEDEDPEEEEFEEEKEPQEEEDMDIDEEEDENEPELTFPYEEADPFNLPSHRLLNQVSSHQRTFLREDGDRLLPMVSMRRDKTLFLVGLLTSFKTSVWSGDVAKNALVPRKKGKTQEKYYGKLMRILGNTRSISGRRSGCNGKSG
ncbi:hypothetical protein Tco_1004320 [Tanacetum coccineum]|uniref:Uncharacterized protein n=1 Tax=Tanacetum coccineum TaxID=301880 RepID=A0ABQ5FDX6_9ASTR